uniref:Glycosyltransferase family 1 protein n=1 Tax=Ammonifex degensii TaxID=42838 RepID=A0A7C2J0F3_9THEO
MAKLRNQDIVCLSSADWEPLWTRKQQVLSRLDPSNRILYVEPPGTLISPFKDPSFWRKWRPWGWWVGRPQPNIHVFHPPFVLPFGNLYPAVGRLNQYWLALWVRRAMREMRMKRPILWTYLPGAAVVARLVEHKLLVYDCVDEHGAYKGLVSGEAVWKLEKDLLGLADVTFVTAPGLYERRKEHTRRIYYLPNAADIAHFNKACNPETPVPQEMERLPRPRLCFVGVIQEWVDTELLAYVARERPQWTFVLIGPVAPGVNLHGLDKVRNVYFLGRKPREELPNYLKGCDVCLNPFRASPLTANVSPLKLYEYLASGRPVVSVDMPAVKEFADVVAVAADAPGFVTAVERMLVMENAVWRKRRLVRAREHSWEARVAFIEEKIAAALREKEQV